MLFPMDKLHISETWQELSSGLKHTNIDRSYMLQLVMTDLVDVLFDKDLRIWLFASYLTTLTLPNWKVMNILHGWSLQKEFSRKLIMEEVRKYGEHKDATAILFNIECPWLSGLTGGTEWQRLKW